MSNEVDDEKDPYHSVWQDPTNYTHEVDGPPYLPNQEVSPVKVAARDLILKEAHGKTAHLHNFIHQIVEGYQSYPVAELGSMLAFLKALAHIHQAHHWMTRGPNFYADHLLFDRLYGDLVGEIDSIAERAVGSGDIALVNPVINAMHVAAIVSELYEGSEVGATPDRYVEISLRAETRFLAFMRIIAGLMKGKGQLSRGTDNLLQGIEDKHEEHVYLLKQRTQTGTMKVSV